MIHWIKPLTVKNMNVLFRRNTTGEGVTTRTRRLVQRTSKESLEGDLERDGQSLMWLRKPKRCGGATTDPMGSVGGGLEFLPGAFISGRSSHRYVIEQARRRDNTGA